MAKISYSDNVKSAICGTIFTIATLGFLINDSYVKRRIEETYQKIDSRIGELDGKEGTTLADWNIVYQKALGRELNLGEHPREVGLESLIQIENKLLEILPDNPMYSLR